jgi:hypothetical protein
MSSKPDFWRGLSIGLAVLAATVLAVPRGASTTAHADPMQGVDNQGKFTLAVGGSEPNRYDMVWVLHEHPPYSKLKPERGADGFQKPTQITLALYKIEKQGEKMKLVAARDIAYDLEFQNLNQEQPDVKFVYKNLKDQADEKK